MAFESGLAFCYNALWDVSFVSIIMVELDEFGPDVVWGVIAVPLLIKVVASAFGSA
jgi:hypothetical protein